MRSLSKESGRPVVLKEGRFIRLLKKDGWEYVERSNCSGIVIIIGMTSRGRVLFTEQFRPPVGKPVIEFPAGLVNDGKSRKRETMAAAARRELLEETGYLASRLVKILSGPVSSGLTTEEQTIYRALNLKKVGQGGGDPTESITVHEVPLRNVPQWLKQKQKSGCLVDPKVYAGLYFINSQTPKSKANPKRQTPNPKANAKPQTPSPKNCLRFVV
jgi:ADP-ribose pyrophosphatase